MLHRSGIALLVALLGCGGLVACGGASAQDQTQAPSQSAAPDAHAKRGPPPEAFTACEGKMSGEACVVHFDDTDTNGNCAKPPAESSETRLLCMPKDHPHGPPDGEGGHRHGGHHGPPGGGPPPGGGFPGGGPPPQ
jgi:hypothetical protein